jgi:cysteine desulfurase family protein
VSSRAARIYLDNAATSWPKPPEVYSATEDYQRNLGANAGRGSYQSAMRSRAIVEQARDAVRQLFQAPGDFEICFGFSGTDVLNLGLHGWLQGPGHVITSVVEHNSVLRPLRFLAERNGLEISYATCDAQGRVTPDSICQSLRRDTRLIALTHASNVTGCIQPIHEIGQIARDRGVCFLVDAAQSAGHLPIDLRRTPIDILASSGHKGLLGPLGTGVVCLAPRLAQELTSFRQGGTGSSSDRDWQPDLGPDKFEAGSANLPGLSGLRAGLQYVLGHAAQIRAHEMQLVDQLLAGLRGMPAIQVPGPPSAEDRVGVVSFTVRGWDCHDVAGALDVAQSIELRSGLMCAPRMHAALGLPQGTVRASFGPFNSEQDVMILLSCLAALPDS